MRFALLRSELRIHLAQRSLWLGLPTVAAFGAVLANGVRAEQDLGIASGFHLFNLHVVLLIMSLPFIVGVLGMTAFLRDSQHRFSELSYSTPISSTRFLMSRYAGLVASIMMVLVAAQAGIVAGIVLKAVQPIAALQLVADLLWIVAVVVLPAVLLYSALYILLGTFTRNAIALHFAMLVAFMTYMLVAARAGSPVLVSPGLPNPSLVTLMLWLDPFAMAPVSEQAEALTIAARNASRIALDQPLILNRLIVLSLAAGMLGMAVRRFDLRLPRIRNRRGRTAPLSGETAVVPAYAACAVKQGSTAQWHAFLSLCRMEYATTLKSNVFLLIVVVWSFIIGGEVFSGLTWLEPMATRVPGTADALNRFQWDIVPQVGMFVLLLLASELMWRDRTLGISAIVASTPAGNAALLVSKWLSLVMIVITLLTVSVALAIASQLMHGSPVDAGMYAMYFVYVGLPLICAGTLCLAVHAISPGKLPGIAITFAVLVIALTPLASKMGIEHPLLHFAQTPLQPWSDITGHAGTDRGFWGFMLFWVAVSALLMVLAYGAYHRGLQDKPSWRKLDKRPRWAIAVCAALAFTVVSGWHVERELRRDNYFLTTDEYHAWKAGYETKFGRYKGAKSPAIKHANYDVSVLPGRRRVQVSGEYTLTNPHAVPLEEVLVSTHMNTRSDKVQLESARLDEHDTSFGQYRFALEPAMQPGERRTLHFETVLEQSGYSESPGHALIATGFSYLRVIPFLPTIGYVEQYELADNALRKSFDLAERPEPKTLAQAIAETGGDFRAEYDWVTAETRISTIDGETAIAQGEFLGSHEEDGRRIFRYKTRAPIRNLVAFYSGALDMRSRLIDGIELEVYFKRGHERNVEHILNAVADAVTYLQENVGPYPYGQLRLIESPRGGMTGYALPQTIMIGEDVSFKANLDDPDGFDHVYRRTVHEVAHQWFGHGIGNGVPADGNFLVESLAKYVELVLLRRKHGVEAVQKLVAYELGRYQGGRGRAVDAEEPLALADATHVVYSKASVVFYQLLDALGEEPINRTLSELWRHHYYPEPPATSLDFVRELKRNSDTLHHALIEDLLLTSNSQRLLSESELDANAPAD